MAGGLAAIFKAYDIRGVVPDELDERRAFAIGAGFARFCSEEGDPRRVVVAHDARPSGETLSGAFSAGVESEGLEVVPAGLCSTDLVYFASGSLGLPAAMLTASHNPPEYNGIKLCLAGAKPIAEDSGLGTIRLHAEEVLDGLGAEVPPSHASPDRRDWVGDFADHVRSFIDPELLRPLDVVADTANGMGGLIVPRVFEGLPFRLDLLYPELDGTFPNHPANPIEPENLKDLRQRILETGAEVGLAFDGDADRVFLIDERAETLSGSTTTAIVAKAMLERSAGETVLYNLICSKAVPEVIEECGGVAVRTRVGHSFIKAKMAQTGAIFAGEHSGHYYFRDNFRADSGIIAALVVLEELSKAGVPLSVLRKPFERYADSGEINSRADDPKAVIERVAGHYGDSGAEIDRLDGLTVDLGAWWFNLRPSNTEPLLRLNVEAADDEQLAAHVEEVRTLVEAAR